MDTETNTPDLYLLIRAGSLSTVYAVVTGQAPSSPPSNVQRSDSEAPTLKPEPSN